MRCDFVNRWKANFIRSSGVKKLAYTARTCEGLLTLKARKNFFKKKRESTKIKYRILLLLRQLRPFSKNSINIFQFFIIYNSSLQSTFIRPCAIG
jgi:hypothetical protein